MTAAALAVLVSTRTDPVSGRTTRNRNDALALALALSVAGDEPLRVVHAGTMDETVAREYLALGAPAIELLEPAPGAAAGVAIGSPSDAVAVLARAVASTPMLLCGVRANDHFGSGLLPYALAGALGRPVVTAVIALQAEGPAWIVTQALARGARRRLRLSGPAVLAVSPATPLPLRHSFADASAGRVLRHRVPPEWQAQAEVGQGVLPEQRVPAARQLKPLEARLVQSGQARLRAALGGAAPTGGTVITEGTAQEKAQAVLQYLRRHALVNF